MLEHSAETISVEADATELPSSIEIDVTGLTGGATIHARDVKLPAGTTLAEDGDKVLVHVINTPSAAQMEAEGSGDVTVAEVEQAEEDAAAAEAAEG
jgi:large subunit ribosomal protein L25